MEDEETVALAAAIRQPWQPQVPPPYEPAPYEPAPNKPAPAPAALPGPFRAVGWPASGYPAQLYAVPAYQVPAYPIPGYRPSPYSPSPDPAAAYTAFPYAPAPYPVAGYAVPVYPVPVVSRRHVAVAYLLWFFLGLFGIHQFYLGARPPGVLYLLTGGVFGLGLLVDLFLIPSMTRRRNAEAVGRAYLRWNPQLR